MAELLAVWSAFGIAGLLLFIKEWPTWTWRDWFWAVMYFVLLWPLTWALYFLLVSLEKDK